MKLIVQRVRQASCTVGNTVTGSIEHGLVVYVGFTQGDTITDISYLARKLVHLRIFEDEQGVMNTSLLDHSYAILSISQFTLYGDTTKGHRPSYTNALHPEQAEPLYQSFNQELRSYGVDVQTGRFGAHMIIVQTNDGPVTIELRSKLK